MLNPQPNYEIPEETQRIARAAFSKGNPYMHLRDEVGTLYEDEAFEHLYSCTGQPAIAPWRLVWITVMQFAENLTDRQAADAVRGRIDWKYVLALPLADAGFHYSVLSEFRDRLVSTERDAILLERLLDQAKEKGWLKGGRRQRTDSSHVLANIQQLNRIELVGETLRHALNEIARREPEWLQVSIPSAWWQRYVRRIDETRLPKGLDARKELAETIGRDGLHLVALVNGHDAPPELAHLEAIRTLELIWRDHYDMDDPDNPTPRWRGKGTLPPTSQRLVSPHDTEARYGFKDTTQWRGYKVHFTEVCEPHVPHLVVHVHTTDATVQDVEVVETIHANLERKGLLPDEHLMDGMYMGADQIANMQSQYGVSLVGPVRPDVSWQAQDPDAYDITHFEIDWENQQATCPQGKTSHSWKHAKADYGRPYYRVTFHKDDCLPCPARQLCTRSKSGSRSLSLLHQPTFEALSMARQRQETDDFREQYHKRAGVEGTMNQTMNGFSMRRNRYTGLAKTRLQHIATSVAVNFQRLWAWLMGIPTAKTQTYPFAILAP